MWEMLTARFAEFLEAAKQIRGLKNGRLEVFSTTNVGRMQTLDSLPHVGALSPTRLMCRILALKSAKEPYLERFKYDFLKRLPPTLFERYKTKRWEDPMAFSVMVESDWNR